MRNKLLLSAAIAVAMGFSAVADTTPVVKPEKNVIDIDASPLGPTEADEAKELPTDALFGPDPQRQAANIEQNNLDEGSVQTADVTQTGQQNLAQIRQTGENNDADITQSDLATGASFSFATNIGVIGQTGAGNDAEISQTNTADTIEDSTNVADIHQFSSGGVVELDVGAANNFAAINQDGALFTTAQINQGTLDAGAEGNTAAITQTATTGAVGATTSAAITQQGIGNAAEVSQTATTSGSVTVQQTGSDDLLGAGEANDASVVQDAGSGSEVVIVQSAVGFIEGTDGNNFANVFQAGDGNLTAISQEQDGNDVEVNQFGNGGTILLNQNDEAGNPGRNLINATQSGEDNFLAIEQDNVINEATVNQIAGSGNLIEIDQGTFGFGGGFFTEGLNETDITQEDSVGSTIDLVQAHGSDEGETSANTALIQQIAFTTDSSIGISQIGSGHAADITQSTATGSSIDLLQGGAPLVTFGDFNTATIIQSGTDNRINAVQLGDDNTALIDQNGADSEINLEQTGDVHTAELAQDAIDSNIHVFQTGINQTAFVDQFANSSDALVVQTGANNIATINQGAF